MLFVRLIQQRIARVWEINVFVSNGEIFYLTNNYKIWWLELGAWYLFQARGLGWKRKKNGSKKKGTTMTTNFAPFRPGCIFLYIFWGFRKMALVEIWISGNQTNCPPSDHCFGKIRGPINYPLAIFPINRKKKVFYKKKNSNFFSPSA